MCGDELERSLALRPEQRKVLRAIRRCRTAELGGHLDVCEGCGYERPAYNSCRNRHCPKCQALDQHRWLERRRQRILPVHHFHVVFTLPAELRPLIAMNRKALFALLFATGPASLLELGRDPRRLGGELGISAVLHTWRRDLGFHPHLHCVVTGGGLDGAGRWRSTRPGFLFPVRVLGKLLRGKFLAGLRALHARGAIVLPTSAADGRAVEELLDRCYQKRWIVYSKPPFGGADAVFSYLGRYTHRIGISNSRLLDVSERAVVFRTRFPRTASLPPRIFLARFLSHVLPPGFVRIRHYGLLASGNVRGRLAQAQRVLEPSRSTDPVPAVVVDGVRDQEDEDEPLFVRLYRELTGIDLRVCPRCDGALRPHPLPTTAQERAPP